MQKWPNMASPPALVPWNYDIVHKFTSGISHFMSTIHVLLQWHSHMILEMSAYFACLYFFLETHTVIIIVEHNFNKYLHIEGTLHMVDREDERDREKESYKGVQEEVEDMQSITFPMVCRLFRKTISLLFCEVSSKRVHIGE